MCVCMHMRMDVHTYIPTYLGTLGTLGHRHRDEQSRSPYWFYYVVSRTGYAATPSPRRQRAGGHTTLRFRSCHDLGRHITRVAAGPWRRVGCDFQSQVGNGDFPQPGAWNTDLASAHLLPRLLARYGTAERSICKGIEGRHVAWPARRTPPHERGNDESVSKSSPRPAEQKKGGPWEGSRASGLCYSGTGPGNFHNHSIVLSDPQQSWKAGGLAGGCSSLAVPAQG